MKLVSLLFICCQANMWASSVTPDTLLSQLRKDGSLWFIQTYEKEITESMHRKAETQISEYIQTGLLAVAYRAEGDTAQYVSSATWLKQNMRKDDQRRAVLQFLFNRGGDFISKRPLYLAMQQLGIDLASAWKEPRVQFAFLENCMGLELFTKNAAEKERLIREMKIVSLGNPYLTLRTTYHRADYFQTQRNDSCVYLYETFINGFKPWLGQPNPYFLQETSWIQKADSGMLASAYRGYALYLMTKGDIKKAGQLLVLGDRLIPDTAVYDVRKIENQISLSSLYADLVNKEKTLEYALKAVARCEKHKHTKLRNGRVAHTYARALMVNGQYDEAAIEYEKAYSYYMGSVGKIDPKRQAYYLSILSSYIHDLQKALQWIRKAEAIDAAPDDEIRYLGATALGLSNINSSHPGTALRHLEEAQQLAEQSKNVRWLRESLYHLYLFYKSNGRPAESLKYYEAFVQFNDSLYRSGQELALFDIEASYQKSLQDETIARLDAENAMADTRLKAQKRNLIAVLTGLGLVSILLLIVLQLYRKVRASNITISKAIEEKNILLREIHHRVKNNLQVISSLLKLQSGYIKDDAAIQAIAEGRSRVQSMALLHQNLYKEDNLTGVNMKVYFDNLIQGLFDTYNISPDRITLHKKIAEIHLDVDTVVPLGLITNELISNALKHAFPGQSTGNLYVELYEKNDQLILKVGDDGSGLSDVQSRDGFGTKLIQSLSQKLEADITIKSNQGTQVVLTIRDYRKAA